MIELTLRAANVMRCYRYVLRTTIPGVFLVPETRLSKEVFYNVRDDHKPLKLFAVPWLASFSRLRADADRQSQLPEQVPY